MHFFLFFFKSMNYYSKFFAFESCVYMFSYPLVRISHLDNAFSKILELKESPEAEHKNSEKNKMGKV